MPARRMPWPACLWPGLPSLWMRGAWSGLVLAIGFAALLNALLATTLVWAEWVDPGLRSAGWVALLGVWLIGLVAGRLGWDLDRAAAWGRARLRLPPAGGPQHDGADAESGGDLFLEAQLQYLRGNWLQAENLLRRLIQSNAGDVEARLMLVTLCRHLGRHEEASAELRRLAALEDAGTWQREIDDERAFLAGRHNDQAAPVQSASDT